MLTNVGSAGPAPAAGAAAAGGAAAPAEAAAEEKVEGKFRLDWSTCWDGLLTPTQRRRSPMTTWDSDFSTKRFNRSEVEVVSFLPFPLPFIPLPPCGSLDDSLLYSILHDPCYEDLNHGEEKKKIAKFKRTRTFNGDWVLGLPPPRVPEVESIGCLCDSETYVASKLLGEFKRRLAQLFSYLTMVYALVWQVDVGCFDCPIDESRLLYGLMICATTYEMLFFNSGLG